MDRRKRTARTVALMSLFSMTDTQENVSVASFDGDGSDLISLIVGIDPVQAGSGDPSPDNVRPISGWTEAKVTRTGKNLYSRDNGKYNVPVYGVDGSSASYPDVHVVWIPVKPNTKYTVASAGTESTTFYFRWINCTADKSFISRPGSFNSAQFPLSFITPANCYWVEVGINQYNTEQISQNDWEISVVATTETTYEPYQGETYSIIFPSEAGIVYSGALDVTTGKLTVDRANIASYNGEQLPSTWISDRDVYAVGTTPTTGAQVVYKLATPIVYDLTPTEINTLLGTNNIWADTGEIKYIEYNA